MNPAPTPARVLSLEGPPVEMAHADHVSQAVMSGLKPARNGKTGVLMFWFLSVPQAFRLAPPLTATDQEMEEGLALVLEALDSVK